MRDSRKESNGSDFHTKSGSHSHEAPQLQQQQQQQQHQQPQQAQQQLLQHQHMTSVAGSTATTLTSSTTPTTTSTTPTSVVTGTNRSLAPKPITPSSQPPLLIDTKIKLSSKSIDSGSEKKRGPGRPPGSTKQNLEQQKSIQQADLKGDNEKLK
jgi:hypothetical protein